MMSHRTKNRVRFDRTRLVTLVALIYTTYFCIPDSFAQWLDETWSVTINGQTVQVEPSGSFRVPNISAADLFGPGGPGTRPDFLSDDFLRAVAVSTTGGVTQYAFSEPFQIRSGETFLIGDMTITEIPPPFPETLRMSADDSTLTAIGQTTQLHVTGVLADGREIDLTSSTQWTVYRTSNPQAATVDRNGLITAHHAGTVFITAVNEGTTAVKKLLVAPGDPLTTLEGFVQFDDGTPVQGALVTLVGLAGESITNLDGFFQMIGVPSQLGQPLTVRASILIGTESFIGTKQTVSTVPAGLTDAGIITVGTSGGGLGPMILSGMDPEDHGFFGYEMIRDIMNFVVSESAIRTSPSNIVMLGASPPVATDAADIAKTLGFTLTHVAGEEILQIDFFDYDAIYMATSAADNVGGITTREVAYINQRGPDIIDFVNSGGGLAAFSQNVRGGYQWFPPPGIQPVDLGSERGISLTPAGEFILSPSAVSVEPFHNGFVGPAGFFGLEVLATGLSGNMIPLIIGGFASIPTESVADAP